MTALGILDLRYAPVAVQVSLRKGRIIERRIVNMSVKKKREDDRNPIADEMYLAQDVTTNKAASYISAR